MARSRGAGWVNLDGAWSARQPLSATVLSIIPSPYPTTHPPRTVTQPGTSAEALQKTLLLAGFPGAAAAPGGGIAASKPAWATGAKAAIALKPRAPQQQQPAVAAPAAATWTLAVDGEEDGEEELVDDEALLTEEDKQRPALAGELVSEVDCRLGACRVTATLPGWHAHARSRWPLPPTHPVLHPALMHNDDCEVGASSPCRCL